MPNASQNAPMPNSSAQDGSAPAEGAISTATVIGAGTMGAAIAAHLANAGLNVYLLDIAETSVTDTSVTDTSVTDTSAPQRNAIVAAGFERMRNARPAALFSPQVAHQITLGNLDDDLETSVAASDWIIEAIVEKLEPKQALMARLEACAPAHAIISTNTSGLPIHAIVAERSADFQRRFLGTHFFNPPRYLYLLELIPTAATDPTVVDRFHDFATHTLGKGVVVCKDTPNFIANRMISYIISGLLEFAVEHGYTVEEVDYLAGPLIGRPRSGLFRLLDVIGIDVMAQINRNLYDLIPHDPDRDTLVAPLHTAVWNTLIAAGHLGAKSGQGFYKTVTDDAGNRQFWALDLQAARQGEVSYRAPQTPDFPELAALRRHPLAERVQAILAHLDQTDAQTDAGARGAALVWHTLAHALIYAARRQPEIADNIADIDRVMRWGFIWEMGPFELWDALGMPAVAARMNAWGITLPDWVQEMLEAGHTSFYRASASGAREVYDPAKGSYIPLPGQVTQWNMPAIRRAGSAVYANDAATLHLLPGSAAEHAPILVLEFHSKLNALDPGALDVLDAAHDTLLGDGPTAGTGGGRNLHLLKDVSVAGLLIANAGLHFCVGANLQHMLDAARAQEWEKLTQFIARGQNLFLALRRGGKPVVAAPFQRVLGGGVEVCLAAQRVVAQAETYMGLVETSVGLIPGWGGCKELVRRHVRPGPRTDEVSANEMSADEMPADEMPAGLERIFTTILNARVSTSAQDARHLGLLDSDDIIAMNPELLIANARDQLYALAATPPAQPAAQEVYAAGRAGLDLLHAQIEDLHARQELSDHDRLIARKLAWVLCDDGAPGLQREEDFLDRERAAFVSLAGEAKTQERMAHMLAHGKPLRN